MEKKPVPHLLLLLLLLLVDEEMASDSSNPMALIEGARDKK